MRNRRTARENMRRYGQPPYRAAVVHGGPGAAGEMAPAAEAISEWCGVLEPMQTADSLDAQIEELWETLAEYASLPLTLIGWSWGAWLSLILSAEYPHLVSKLVLVACPPLEKLEKRFGQDIMRVRLERLSEADRKEVRHIMKQLQGPDCSGKNELLARFGELVSGADLYDPIPHRAEIEYRYDIYEGVWEQGARMRDSGRLLSLAADISREVVAIHGDCDPHPSRGVEQPLSRVLQRFRFIPLEHCGHAPWLERSARNEFFGILKRELGQSSTST